MLTYLACGIPAVVSPIGMNQEVLKQASCGFEAITHDDWVDAIDTLLTFPKAATEMGSAGRALVERAYSIEVLAPQFADLLSHYAGKPLTTKTPITQGVG